MKLLNYSLYIILFFIALSCTTEIRDERPNVILIMADDMGYECISSYEGSPYHTPVLDSLASEGIRFSNCVSQPLCTPSRVKIMTGLYNHRNYEYFGFLNSDQYTFGNLMKDAGYSTCIAGKWQLNGLSYKDSIPDWNDPLRPNRFGFDEYCLWQLTKDRKEGERYADPLIEQNGEILARDPNNYGPDIFSDYILDFISRKKDSSFFVYYPMALVHDPFVPTPDSKQWENPEMRYRKDTSYFKDMVAYADKIVGRIAAKLEELNLSENTILIFTGDNGTNTSISTPVSGGYIQGGKGNTIDAGTHVPLIVYWPGKIKKGFVYGDLIEFSDFFPTLADIAGIEHESDGKSFYSLLKGEKHEPRQTAFVHYDPRWSDQVDQYRNQFARTIDYKLYQDGKFFHLSKDILEESALKTDSLSGSEYEIRNVLEGELQKHPAMKETD